MHFIIKVCQNDKSYVKNTVSEESVRKTDETVEAAMTEQNPEEKEIEDLKENKETVINSNVEDKKEDVLSDTKQSNHESQFVKEEPTSKSDYIDNDLSCKVKGMLYDL